MAEIVFDGVGKVFPDGTRAVEGLTLTIEDGEFMVLVGPSGCGKTTALRMLAGLEDITEGTIFIGDEPVNDLDPRARDVAMVFQNYALYPNMSVADNIGFGLKMRRVRKSVIRTKVEEIARTLDLTELLQRKPGALSGGQRQRVAMGRAIVREPRAFLMDEPLSNLDAKLRVQMRSEIARIQRDVGATTVYVTHDQVEAMTMGDRVAVMRKGELQQLATPEHIYDRPANLFVASFIGSPPMNLVEATVHLDDDDRIACRVGDQSILLPKERVDAALRLPEYVGQVIGFGVRPEHLQDPEHAPRAFDGQISGVVVAAEVLGAEVLVHLEIEAPPVVADELLEIAADVDAAAAARIEAERRARRTVLVGRFARATNATVGATFTAAIATEGLHFFDLATGRAIVA